MKTHQPAPSYSLQRRLQMWLLVPLLAIGAAALYDAARSARLTADEIADRVLAGSALAIAERVFVNDDGELEVDIPYVALEMLTSSEQDRVFYRIDGPNNLFLTGYRRLVLPAQFARQEGNTQFGNTEFRGVPVRVAVLEGAASSSSNSRAFRVSVAETTNGRAATAQEILVRSALRQAVLILTAAIVVWFAVSRALQPLYRLQDAVGRRSARDLRPIEHDVPREVDGLVWRINDLLHRFENSLSALRNFSSNASHQLRTPLSVIQNQIDIAERSADPAARQDALGEAKTAIDDAEKVISQLMLLARIDEAAQTEWQQKSCDVAEICRGVCADFIAQHTDPTPDIGYDGPSTLIVQGDDVLMRELVKNLIENAYLHAGQLAEITCRTGDQDGAPFLEVEDNGSGISPAQRRTVLKRFGRDRRDNLGSGIGLSISNEIAQLFGGALSLLDAPTGSGLRVRVELTAGAKPAN
jgi:two-component system sensor histidine kinase TctE